MIVGYLEDLGVTDVLILLGLAAVSVKTVLEAKGWTPTNRLLRDENDALVERNTTLEKTLDRERAEWHAAELKLQGQIDVLKAKVVELEARDQAAVLERLDRLELARREDHQEAMGVWTRVAAALEGGTT